FMCLVEKLPRCAIACLEHLRKTLQASIGLTKQTPATDGIQHHGIVGGFPRNKRARSLAAHRDEPGLLERSNVTGGIRLAFRQKLGEFSHAELLLSHERQNAQAHRLRKSAVKLPTSVGKAFERHMFLYIHIFE